MIDEYTKVLLTMIATLIVGYVVVDNLPNAKAQEGASPYVLMIAINSTRMGMFKPENGLAHTFNSRATCEQALAMADEQWKSLRGFCTPM
ncbi:MAG: hypothetical protein HOJ76_12970 [Proteobacteria bacterium]|jgi:hypothetical protein|nr:hypothetical protein [Pseudomonadota bacterium]